MFCVVNIMTVQSLICLDCSRPHVRLVFLSSQATVPPRGMLFSLLQSFGRGLNRADRS